MHDVSRTNSNTWRMFSSRMLGFFCSRWWYLLWRTTFTVYVLFFKDRIVAQQTKRETRAVLAYNRPHFPRRANLFHPTCPSLYCTIILVREPGPETSSIFMATINMTSSPRATAGEMQFVCICYVRSEAILGYEFWCESRNIAAVHVRW